MMLIGNALLLEKFFAAGRGQYADAVAFMAKAGVAPVRFSGYHPFSIEKATAYHAKRAGLAKAIRFIPTEEDARDPAGLFIDGHFNGSPPAKISLAVSGGLKPYRLQAVFPHWGLSGDTWAIYRRVD
jgi:hypothetical protein